MAGRDCLDGVVWAERGIGDGATSVRGSAGRKWTKAELDWWNFRLEGS